VAARITRADAAPPYSPPLHSGVDACRLQGLEAGPTERFWVGLSVYSPGGAASLSPTAQETVYVVLEGELELAVPAEDVRETLRPGDSVHLPQGTVRSVTNVSGAAARLLVVLATPDGPR
jgi:uncharacterized cupin superfamily protein